MSKLNGERKRESGRQREREKGNVNNKRPLMAFEK
jgi:hypothetical protein